MLSELFGLFWRTHGLNLLCSQQVFIQKESRSSDQRLWSISEIQQPVVMGCQIEKGYQG